MIPTLNKKYWNDRYLNNDFGWDLGAVSTPLKTYFDQLTDKTNYILIPGAGNAYEAEYLVTAGFTNVFVCDLAPEPLHNLKQRCPAFKKENLVLVDFFELDNKNKTVVPDSTAHELPIPISRSLSSLNTTLQSFDLIVEQTFFCALHPSLRKKYFQKTASLLKPGGKLVGVLFDDRLNTDKPPFGGNKEEYLNYIDSSFKIRTFERCYNSIKPREGRELFINLERTL